MKNIKNIENIENKNNWRSLELKKFYSTSEEYLERLKKHNKKKYIKYISICKKELILGSNILECGCGTGESSKLLAESGYNVVAIDISELFINEAKKNYSENNLKFIVQDASNLEFPDNLFDAVCSFEFIEHVVDVERVMIEMGRVVKPGGKIIIFMPNYLYPIRYLKEFFNWKRKKYYRPWEARSRFIAFKNLIKTIYIFILKMFFVYKKIYYLDPVLLNHEDACGRDFDVTWLSNYFDVKRILKNQGFHLQPSDNKDLESKPFYARIASGVIRNVKHSISNHKRYCITIGEK